MERVASLQYYELVRRGYHIFTIYGKAVGDNDAIPNQYQLPVPEKLYSKSNIAYIRDFVKQKNISIVFNFSAAYNKSSLCLVEACRAERVPIVSILHNTLEYALWNFPVVKNLMEYNCVRPMLRNLLGMVHRIPFYKGGRYLHDYAAATVVLAPCYVDEYKRIVGRTRNVFPIRNPLPMSADKTVDWDGKENIALFVGRLERQKSVDKLIRIWSKLDMPQWRLFIIGNGSQENNLKRLARELGVESTVSFEGHQNPLLYYRRAKLFCLTSIYEGYPMTLIECQAFGVVPILYDSFLAARDIVRTGENGLLISAFREQDYVQGLKELMSDNGLLRQIGERCYKESEEYSVDLIIKQWVKLIENYRINKKLDKSNKTM